MPLASVQEIKAGRAIQHGAMEFSTATVDLDTVRRYRLQRLRTKMGELDVSGLLLFNQINTRYAVDATNMQIWCSHYETLLNEKRLVYFLNRFGIFRYRCS